VRGPFHWALIPPLSHAAFASIPSAQRRAIGEYTINPNAEYVRHANEE
jgi:hypothetical protein